MNFNVPFALSITAGMVATVNPCGFALLPAYLGFFVGSDDDDKRSTSAAILRSFVVTATMTLGFVTVFGLVGFVVNVIAKGIQDQLSKVTIGIGVTLVLLGVYLLSGRDLASKLPKIQRGGRDGGLLSMYLFGVSYATASLSCTLGPFLVALTPTFRHGGVLSGLLAYVAYSFGMGLVIGVVTVATALARGAAIAKIRSLLPKINRISGALLVVAGLYVTYYGWWEIYGDLGKTDPIVDRAQNIQGWLTTQIETIPKLPVLSAVMALLLSTMIYRRSRRGRSDNS